MRNPVQIKLTNQKSKHGLFLHKNGLMVISHFWHISYKALFNIIKNLYYFIFKIKFVLLFYLT